MRYRVYSGPRGAAKASPLDGDRMLFKEFASLDAALGWARHLTATGRVPLLIEGDDDTRLDKRAIAAAQTIATALANTSARATIGSNMGSAGPAGPHAA